MIDPVVVLGATGASLGGSIAWVAMSIARTRAQESSELGFIQNAKFAFFLVSMLTAGLLWIAAQIVSLDAELSRQEVSAYYALAFCFFFAAAFIMCVLLLVENAARRKAARDRLRTHARIPERDPRPSRAVNVTTVHALPKMLRPPARALIRPFIGALLIIAWGIYTRSRHPVEGWLAMGGGFSLVILWLAIGLSGRMYLRIEEQQFTISSLFGTRAFSFADIDTFAVYSATQGRKVGWNYRAGTAASIARRINSKALGVDVPLPSNYGMSAATLCNLLNDVLALAQRRRSK
jgi:hypothetical protein